MLADSYRKFFEILYPTAKEDIEKEDIELEGKGRDGYEPIPDEQETPATQRDRFINIKENISTILKALDSDLVQHIHTTYCEHPFNKKEKASQADVIRACEEVYTRKQLLHGYELFHANVATIAEDIKVLDEYLRKIPTDRSKKTQDAFQTLKNDFTAYRKQKFPFVFNRDRVNLDGLMEAYKEYDERVVSQVIAYKEHGVAAKKGKKVADESAIADFIADSYQNKGCR